MRRAMVVLLIMACFAALVSGEIVQVVEFARHGARGPLYDLNPQGSSWLSKWGTEQLTGNGMRMHYHLGKEIAARYTEIFNSNFNPSMMQVKSTNFNRTISSAFSHFTGLVDQFQGKDLQFPDDDPRLFPSAKITIDPKVGFRSALPNKFVPIAAFSRPNQKILQVIREDCPYGKKVALAGKKKVSDYVMNLNSVKDSMADWAKLYGINDLESRFQQMNVQYVDDSKSELDKLFFLTDYMIQDAIHNEDAPINNIDEGKKAIYRKALMGYSVATLARFNDSTYTANIISEFLLDVKNTFETRMNASNPDSLQKYFYYSGHDDLMSAILQSMYQITSTCMLDILTSSQDVPRCEPAPDLAANLVWELHKTTVAGKTETEWSVRVRYNFRAVDFCQSGNVETEYLCPFDKFKEKIAEITFEDWKQWCVTGDNQAGKEDPEEDQFWATVTYSLIGVCALLLIGVVFVSIKLKNALNQHSAKTEDLDTSVVADDSMH